MKAGGAAVVGKCIQDAIYLVVGAQIGFKGSSRTHINPCRKIAAPCCGKIVAQGLGTLRHDQQSGRRSLSQNPAPGLDHVPIELGRVVKGAEDKHPC